MAWAPASFWAIRSTAPAHREAELLGEAGGFAPVHFGHRVNVCEAVAQEQNVGVLDRLPELAVRLEGSGGSYTSCRGKRSWSAGSCIMTAMSPRLRTVIAAAPILDRGPRRERGVLGDERVQSLRDGVHRVGSPVRIGRQELRLAGPPFPLQQDQGRDRRRALRPASISALNRS